MRDVSCHKTILPSNWFGYPLPVFVHHLLSGGDPMCPYFFPPDPPDHLFFYVLWKEEPLTIHPRPEGCPNENCLRSLYTKCEKLT